MKLGALLITARVITEPQLAAALAEQQRWGGKLGEILVRMNVLTEDMLVRALGKQLNIPVVNVDAIKEIPPHVLAKIPAETARDLCALAIELKDEAKTLVVAMAEPQNLTHVDKLRSITRCRVVAQLGGRASISRAFARVFDDSADVSDSDGPYKFVDAQGNTMIKSVDDIKPPAPVAPPAPSRPSAPRPAAPAPPMAEGPPMTTRHAPAGPLATGLSPAEQLAVMEESHRKEVAVLKVMIELLIEKGVFSRDEYTAKFRK